MKSNAWKLTGLAFATMGAMTLAQAVPGEGHSGNQDGPKKEGRKGDHAGKNKNRDGKGDTPGHRPSREDVMKRYDKDGDGQLSEDERAALRQEMEQRRGQRPSREEVMQKYDTDGDGQLSEEERAVLREEMGQGGRRGRGNREEMMKKFDADGDGQLSEEERAAARAEFEKRRQEHQGQGPQ